MLPGLKGELPYDETDMAARAASPSKEEEKAARKVWMRMMRMFNPEKQQSRSTSKMEEHAALYSAVFHVLNELSRR